MIVAITAVIFCVCCFMAIAISVIYLCEKATRRNPYSNLDESWDVEKNEKKPKAKKKKRRPIMIVRTKRSRTEAKEKPKTTVISGEAGNVGKIFVKKMSNQPKKREIIIRSSSSESESPKIVTIHEEIGKNLWEKAPEREEIDEEAKNLWEKGIDKDQLQKKEEDSTWKISVSVSSASSRIEKGQREGRGDGDVDQNCLGFDSLDPTGKNLATKMKNNNKAKLPDSKTSDTKTTGKAQDKALSHGGCHPKQKTTAAADRKISKDLPQDAKQRKGGQLDKKPSDKMVKVKPTIFEGNSPTADGKMSKSGRTKSTDTKISSTDEKTPTSVGKLTNDGRTSTFDGKISSVYWKTSPSGGKTGSRISEVDYKKATGMDDKKGKEADGKLEKAGEQPPLDSQSKTSDNAGGHEKGHKVNDNKISQPKRIIPTILGGSGSKRKEIDGKNQQKDEKAPESKDSVDSLDKEISCTGKDGQDRGKLEGEQKTTVDKAGDHGKGQKLKDKEKIGQPRGKEIQIPSPNPAADRKKVEEGKKTSMDSTGGEQQKKMSQLPPFRPYVPSPMLKTDHQQKNGKATGSKDDSRKKIGQYKPPSLPLAPIPSKEKMDKKDSTEKKPPALPYTPPGKGKVDRKEKLGNLKPQQPSLPYSTPGSTEKKAEKSSYEKITSPRPPNLPYAAPGLSKEKSDDKMTPEKMSAEKPRPPDLLYAASVGRKESTPKKPPSQEKIGQSNPRPPSLPFVAPSAEPNKEKIKKTTPKEKMSGDKPRPPGLPYPAPAAPEKRLQG